MWNTSSLDLKTKETLRLVCFQPYLVPRLNEATFKKEAECTVQMVFLERSNDSEWGAPPFSKTKTKTNLVRFLIEFISINRNLKHNPHPMPKIS